MLTNPMLPRSVKDYINIPFTECPYEILDAFDEMVRLSITKINNMPVYCELTPTGLAVSLPFLYRYRPSVIHHIHKPTLASCLEELKKLEIDESGEKKTEQNNREAEAHSYISEILEESKHIDIQDFKCSICYCFTKRTVHENSHVVCNRCIVRLDKCPICREPIEMLDECNCDCGHEHETDEEYTDNETDNDMEN